MLGLGFINLLVLFLYLVGVTALGVWSMRKVHDMGDFIMPRRFGKWMLTMHAFGSGTHSDQAVSVASKSYTNGLSGIWYQWLYLFGTPFYWLMAPLLRRFRALTTADIFELRYGRSVAMLYAVISIAFMATSIGLMLKGAGAVIAGASGGVISAELSIVLMTVLFVGYGTAGGLGGAIVTDFIQGLLTIVFSFILLPSVLNAVGGLDGIRAQLEDPNMLSLVAPAEIGVFYITVIALNALVGILTQPHILANCAAGKTEREGQFGFMVGSFTKRFCTVAWALTGLAGVVYFAGRELHPDHLYGALAGEFFPQMLPGMLGLFIATLLASVMSSCDSFMIAGSGLFTENFYKKVRPGKSAGHYLWTTRAAALGVVAGGVGYAYWLSDVIQGLEILWRIAPLMGIAFWLGLFWRGATPAAAWASTLAALFTWWLTSRDALVSALDGQPLAETLRIVVHFGDKPEIYLPWQMTAYLTAGFATGILVSLFTRRRETPLLDRYYSLIHTPVLTPEPNPPEPCTLPPGVAPGTKRTFFPGSDFEVPVPSRRALTGFAIGWVLVGAIIGFVAWIAAG
ncbi:MAG: sodium:solute symporter [Opitutales bacterium]